MSAATNPEISAAPTVSHAYPWVPDQGDGTYRNPVLYADYSDPDVIRHGDDFWMTASSFNCTPGLPILHSRDLVNWSLVNHALKNVPGVRYREVQPGCGVWAPSIRHHAGKFWIFFPTPDEGIYLTTASDPRGTWSDPQLVQPGKGLIDPCPLWEDDGRAYLVHAYAHSRAGIKHQLRVVPMQPDGTRVSGEGQVVFHEPERHPTIEGPKWLKRNGWYYLFAPAGGVATGWQTVLRSRNIFGPYEARVVLEQGQTPINGPHQGALVDTPNGEWWFLHFQDAGVYGRVVHLQPVRWRDDWPLMGTAVAGGDAGQPVLQHQKPNLLPAQICVPATSDEFASAALGRQWQWQANHSDGWYSLAERPHHLRLFAQPAQREVARAPYFLGQKFPAREFRVETLVEPGSPQHGLEAGLAIVGESSAALVLRVSTEKCQMVFRDGVRDEVVAEYPGGAVRLGVEVNEGGKCRFSALTTVGTSLKVANLFQATAGKWIGAKVGLYCAASAGESAQGHADFDYFRFLPR